MHLRALIDEGCVTRVEGSLEREISGITCDCRQVFPGMLYIAVPGREDMHGLIDAAVLRGASAVICGQADYVPPRTTCIHVRDLRAALARAAAIYYGNPSSKLRVMALSGAGAAGTAFLLKNALEKAGKKTALLSSLRCEIGSRVLPCRRPNWDSLEVQQMLSEACRCRCELCLIEIPSNGEVDGLAEVHFDQAVLLKSPLEEWEQGSQIETLQRLGRLLERSSKPIRELLQGRAAFGPAGPRPELNFTLLSQSGSPLSFKALLLERRLEGTTIAAEHDRIESRFRVQQPGIKQACAALAAWALGLKMGLTRDRLAHGLETAPCAPGQMEPIRLGQPFAVLVDGAFTPDALRSALKEARELMGARGRLVLVVGCQGGGEAGDRFARGKSAGEIADLTFVTNDNPRNERPEKIAQQFLAGYGSVRSNGWTVQLDRALAIEQAIQTAREGDAVIIAGKGHHTYQEFESTVTPFDDRIHARESLEALGHLGAELPKQWTPLAPVGTN